LGERGKYHMTATTRQENSKSFPKGPKSGCTKGWPGDKKIISRDLTTLTQKKWEEGKKKGSWSNKVRDREKVRFGGERKNRDRSFNQGILALGRRKR